MAGIKKWLLPEPDISEAAEISESCGVSALVGKILSARGFDCERAEKFLNVSPDSFYNPFLLSGMDDAVSTIKKAAADRKKIAVYGDYDVDGITSAYIVYDYLNSIRADVTYYIPDRISEGYGMSCSGIDTLKESGTQLIITVDVGITAVEETAYALEKGMEVIITDHHTLKDSLPQAAAVINPKKGGYPFDALAGVGVALKLVYALSGCNSKIFDKYCGIAAIGTIADMVPLDGENRYIASRGIELIKSTDNAGIRALADVAGKDISKITASDIGFSIAPRLNAAGRMADASLSLELLLDDNPNSALEKARRLNECNRLRQKEEQSILDEALKIIKENSYENDNYILVAKENWMHGVIGIVSSRITEIFCRPSSVVSINEDGTGKASGRSIKGINLFNALSKCSGDLEKFGGHELAAGFTVKADMIDTFRKDMNAYLDSVMTDEAKTPSLTIDAFIEMSDISCSTVESLSVLEPYGIGNCAPRLCLENVKISSIRRTQDGKHAFITVSSGGKSAEIPAFSMSQLTDSLCAGDIISVAGTLSVNTFRGFSEPQLVAKDIHLSELNRCVDRSDLAEIFTILKAEMGTGSCTIKKSTLSPASKSGNPPAFKKGKWETALKIFEELEIIHTKDNGDSLVLSRGKNFKSKTELADSKTYIKYHIKCS